MGTTPGSSVGSAPLGVGNDDLEDALTDEPADDDEAIIGDELREAA